MSVSEMPDRVGSGNSAILHMSPQQKFGIVSAFAQRYTCVSIPHDCFHKCTLRLQVGGKLSRKEMKRKEKTTPFGVTLMRSQVLYRAAQVANCLPCIPELPELCLRYKSVLCMICICVYFLANAAFEEGFIHSLPQMLHLRYYLKHIHMSSWALLA